MKTITFIAIPETECNDTLYCFDCMIGYRWRQPAEYKVYGMDSNVVLFCGRCANKNVIGCLFDGNTVMFDHVELHAPLPMVISDAWRNRGKEVSNG